MKVCRSVHLIPQIQMFYGILNKRKILESWERSLFKDLTMNFLEKLIFLKYASTVCYGLTLFANK